MQKRKMFAALLMCSALVGCTTPPKDKSVAKENLSGSQLMVLDTTVQPMDRVEVINAIKDCQSTGLRAVMIYSKKKVNNYSTPVVVDVTCAPTY